MADYLDKVVDRKQIEQLVKRLRQEGRTIATLNGSFDLLHAGHLHILYEASKQADVLIVALNSDESIRGYKSPTRPIIPLRYRQQMVAALGFVSYVTAFDELDPRELLKQIKPDVHVNGSEYGADCIEAAVVRENGGRIYIVEKIDGLSTSAVIERVKALCD